MKQKIRKYMFVGLVSVMLVAAIAINAQNSTRVFNGDSKPETPSSPTPEATAFSASDAPDRDYFSAFREDRNAVRNEEIAYLDEVIAVSSTDAETLLDAQQQKLALIENMEKEFTIESLITAKGFENAAVLFHGGNVNVVVEANSLNDEQVAQILDIVQRETGESASNIRIIER